MPTRIIFAKPSPFGKPFEVKESVPDVLGAMNGADRNAGFFVVTGLEGHRYAFKPDVVERLVEVLDADGDTGAATTAG